jgi:hypothetical protein
MLGSPVFPAAEGLVGRSQVGVAAALCGSARRIASASTGARKLAAFPQVNFGN